MTDYLQQEKERIARMNAETAHDFHRIEFRDMCAQMIDDAFRQHDQQIEVDIQTTLNGHPTTFSGMIEGLKKDIVKKLQKAFK